MRTARSGLPIHICVFCAFMLPACTRYYDAALHDIALTPQQRLTARVDAMEQSAALALRSLEVAFEVRPGASSTSAHQARLIDDADAAVFEYARQRLIVIDAISESPRTLRSRAAPLKASMLAAEDSLKAAMHAIGQGASGASEPEVHASLDADPEEPSAALNRAEAEIAELSRRAKAFMATCRRAGQVPARRIDASAIQYCGLAQASECSR
jgi:hypothetical protein